MYRDCIGSELALNRILGWTSAVDYLGATGLSVRGMLQGMQM